MTQGVFENKIRNFEEAFNVKDITTDRMKLCVEPSPTFFVVVIFRYWPCVSV